MSFWAIARIRDYRHSFRSDADIALEEENLVQKGDRRVNVTAQRNAES